jgi:hypothetical protein
MQRRKAFSFTADVPRSENAFIAKAQRCKDAKHFHSLLVCPHVQLMLFSNNSPFTTINH